MKHPPIKKSGRGLAEWLSVQFDIPSDLTDGGIRVDLRGRHTLTVQGCRRIVDFSPTVIRLSLGDCTLAVLGERLLCTSYLAGAVGIEGCICCIRFEDPVVPGEVSL